MAGRVILVILLVTSGCLGMRMGEDERDIGVGEEGTEKGDTERVKRLPCPNSEDIFPCECHVSKQYELTMSCHNVESEEQLAQVFSARFPVTAFYALRISFNKNLKVLRKGVFGKVTFQQFWIHFGVLEEVEEGALAGSYDTADAIILQSNNISKFPFHELPMFSKLTSFTLLENQIVELPLLQTSDRVWGLTFGHNLISHIPVNTFRGVPNLFSVNLDNNLIDEIQSGTLTGFPKLGLVSLDHNRLRRIPSGLIDVPVTVVGNKEVTFDNNLIEVVEMASVTGLGEGDEVRLHNNSLTTLDEAAFRPFFEAGVLLTLAGNPLLCECDMAWLVTTPGFMSQVTDAATCHDGFPLADLDPQLYLNLC